MAKRSSDHPLQQRYTTGEPFKVKGRNRVGIVEGFCGYRACGVRIRGKFALSRNLGYKTILVAIRLNVVLTTPSSSGTPREGQEMLRDGTVWGL